MRNKLVFLSLLSCSMVPAMAQVSIGIGSPNVSIGIHLGGYPELVPVPGYPVYYAPGLDSNYFFYDGMYWVYRDDNWYSSSWYNGPWGFVGPEFVPLFVLRVPVRYYRQPPAYFRGWRSDAPPRWGDHWGNDWAQHRSGWDRWDRRAVPNRPPLPSYQRQYSGDRYPRVEQQQQLRERNYRYQPRDPVVRQQYQAQQRVQTAPATDQRGPQGAPQERNTAPRDMRRSDSPPVQQGTPGGLREEPMQQRGRPVEQQNQRSQQRETQPQQPEAQSQQPDRRSHGNEQGAQDGRGAQEPGRENGRRKDRENDDDRGQDRKR